MSALGNDVLRSEVSLTVITRRDITEVELKQILKKGLESAAHVIEFSDLSTFIGEGVGLMYNGKVGQTDAEVFFVSDAEGE